MTNMQINNPIQTTHTNMMSVTELSDKLIVGLNLHALLSTYTGLCSQAFIFYLSSDVQAWIQVGLV